MHIHAQPAIYADTCANMRIFQNVATNEDANGALDICQRKPSSQYSLTHASALCNGYALTLAIAYPDSWGVATYADTQLFLQLVIHCAHFDIHRHMQIDFSPHYAVTRVQLSIHSGTCHDACTRSIQVAEFALAFSI